MAEKKTNEERKENLEQTGVGKFLRVQQEMKVPKSQWNLHGSFSYRSAEDILEEAKQVLSNYKMIIHVEDELELIGDRHYVKAIVTVYDTESDWKTSAKAYAREPELIKGMNGSQITGTASSYARKYAMNGLFAIDDTKDPDAEEVKKLQEEQEKKEAAERRAKAEEERKKKADAKQANRQQGKTQPNATAQKNGCTEQQVGSLVDLIAAFNNPKQKELTILNYYKAKSIEELTVDQADQAIKTLELRVQEGKLD